MPSSGGLSYWVYAVDGTPVYRGEVEIVYGEDEFMVKASLHKLDTPVEKGVDSYTSSDSAEANVPIVSEKQHKVKEPTPGFLLYYRACKRNHVMIMGSVDGERVHLGRFTASESVIECIQRTILST